MNPSEDEKIPPKPAGYDPSLLFAVLIMVVQVLIAVATYPFLPNIVPTHWNAAGQVDGYAPKWFNAVIFPAIGIGLYVLIRGLMRVGPRLGYQRQRGVPQVVNLIVIAVLLFMLVVQLTVTAVSLGLPVDITFVISLSLSVLFIFIGNYLGKLRRNFWAGIRTPWTLASDVVWERTHRVGGWLFVLAGLLGIIMSFVPPLRLWGLLTVIMLVVAVTVVYSFVLYQRLSAGGREPLSPPFDSGEGS